MEKKVALLVTSDQWVIYEASLMLMECDKREQRSSFRTFEFDSGGSGGTKQVTESVWCDLVSRLLEIEPAGERKGMGDMVRRAHAGVRRHGTRARVLNKKGLSKKGRKRCSWYAVARPAG